MSAILRKTYHLLTGERLSRQEHPQVMAQRVREAWDPNKLVGDAKQARCALLRIACETTWIDPVLYEDAVAWVLRQAPAWWQGTLEEGEIIDRLWLEDRLINYIPRGRT